MVVSIKLMEGKSFGVGTRAHAHDNETDNLMFTRGGPCGGTGRSSRVAHGKLPFEKRSTHTH